MRWSEDRIYGTIYIYIYTYTPKVVIPWKMVIIGVLPVFPMFHHVFGTQPPSCDSKSQKASCRSWKDVIPSHSAHLLKTTTWFGSLRFLKFEPGSSGLRPIRHGLASVLKSFVFLLEEPEQLLTRQTLNLSDFKNIWKVVELVNPLKCQFLQIVIPVFRGKQGILKKLTKLISNLFHLLLSLLVVCTIFDDIDIWYVAVPAKIWKHQPVVSPLLSLLYPQISPIGLV